MKKMPCLFQRDFTDKREPRLLEAVTPGCEWVLAGEGVATRKWDGTACAVIKGELYKRYDAKRGKEPPPGAIPCCDPDPVTGHWPHWVKVDPRLAEDRHHAQAWQHQVRVCDSERGYVPRPAPMGDIMTDGTYELCGPKIGANPEGLAVHQFLAHGAHLLPDAPRTFAGLREYLGDNLIEGIVFHREDGRMCKIRRHDYGWPW